MSKTKLKLLLSLGDGDAARAITNACKGRIEVERVPTPRRLIGMARAESGPITLLSEPVVAGQPMLPLLKELRQVRPGIRVLLLADPSDPMSAIEALHEGSVDVVLGRPVSPAELLQALLPRPPAYPSPHVYGTAPVRRAS